jgi:hypothetical protein
MNATLVQTARHFAAKVYQMAAGRMATLSPPVKSRSDCQAVVQPDVDSQVHHGLLLGSDVDHLLQGGGAITSTRSILTRPSSYDVAQRAWRSLGLSSNKHRMDAVGAAFRVPRALVEWLTLRAAGLALKRKLGSNCIALLQLLEAGSFPRLQRMLAWPSCELESVLQACQQAEVHLNSMQF